MQCRKQLVLTGYRVHYVDLREPKPRTPQEQIHVVDRQWLDALGLIGHNVADAIKSQYERAGYKVFGVEPIKPKRVAEIDLCQLWEQLVPSTAEEAPTTLDSEVRPE
ncbi:MAG: hypothetical protein E7448_05785 [Ruminococcaceae bacterium]|nr:hypothetical protein [Oscillospiraceae bacterium]